jgi:chromosomal replication initiator protein
LSPEDLKGKKRTSEIANARQIAMYIIREITELSLPLIGEYFGGRDHTTVLYALRKVENDMSNDVRLRSQVNDFISNLKK